MRIIAGLHRGRRLAAPPGLGTRPMLDRVREALFSTLGALVEGARVLDLCAGSGSLGLEALSRGASTARFVEHHRRTLAVLRSNVEALGLGECAQVVAGDALEPASWGSGSRFELVFFDPPYPWLRAGERRAGVLGVVQRLAREHLAPGGTLVLHAPRASGLAVADFGPGLAASLREYGSNALWYLRKSETEGA